MKPSAGTAIASAFFAAALSVFLLFVFLQPLDWQQPETLRLHYYGLQSELTGGPLSAALSLNDLLKPLAWRAQGGMFDGRYPIMLIDALIPKLYQILYPLAGPFLGEPVNLVLILATAFLLVAGVARWSGSAAAGGMAAGFWLVTSQTLLDSRYPIRLNAALITFLFVYLLWETGRPAARRFPWPAVIRLTLALSLAIFSHEFSLLFGPVLVLLILLHGRSRRPALPPALLALALSWGLYLAVLFIFLPPLARRVVGEWPPLDWMTGGFQPILARPVLLLERFREYLLVGLKEFGRQNLGGGIFLPFWAKLGSAGALLAFLAAPRREGWRRSLPWWLAAGGFLAALALLMFPVVPASVEMPVYYYAPVAALAAAALGVLLSGLDPRRDGRRWALAAVALAAIGAANTVQSRAIMKGMPGDFGFTPRMREYVRDILSARGREEGPVYTAYPRPRAFGISERWDIMLRVWHGEADQVFSLMMPVLHLRRYEDRTFLGDPDEFAALAAVDRRRYEESARFYWDLPSRRFFRLAEIARAVSPASAPFWRGPQGAPPVAARPDGSLLGVQPRALLPAGIWTAPVPAPSSALTSSPVIVLMVRADRLPPGPEDVMNRTEPLPYRSCRVVLKDRATGETAWEAEQTYGWSWQLLAGVLPRGGGDLVVENRAEAEVVGPVVVERDKLPPPLRETLGGRR